MLIGENYDKIEFDLFGLDLLEPNAFIGDTLLFILSIYFFFRIGKQHKTDVFLRSWRLFYLFFGTGFLLGGLGHLLYNYWGIPGKAPSWYLSVIAVYYIERGMLTLLENDAARSALNTLSRVKLVLALLGVTAVLFLVDLKADYSKGMMVPTLNSTIGLVTTLGFLAYRFSKKIPGFAYFWISVLVLFPAAIIQSMKINLHPWFDKNDAGHLLLLLSLWLYFKGIRAYQRQINN